MNLLLVNVGSSSIKCSFYRLSQPLQAQDIPLWQAHLRWKGAFTEPSLLPFLEGTPLPAVALQVHSLEQAWDVLLSSLIQDAVALLPSLDAIEVIGHRIVHGGDFVEQSAWIDASVRRKIEAAARWAPLHNPPALKSIETLSSLCRNARHLALFDTAFHRTLPLYAKVYPGPYRWYEEGIERYGFHGINFRYCLQRLQTLKGKLPERVLICHLGAGASLCAVRAGESIDTSMGLTPLEGLMMDTRSGSVDPGILLDLLAQGKDPQELLQELYEQSGLLGISGLSSGMQDILQASQEGHARARLALSIYLHRLQKEIGSLVAVLEGVDAIVFTGGIGEHSSWIREEIGKKLSFLGFQIDRDKNRQGGQERLMSRDSSSIEGWVIPAREEWAMASECWKRDNSL